MGVVCVGVEEKLDAGLLEENLAGDEEGFVVVAVVGEAAVRTECSCAE